jgi:hypothetical protein
MILCLIGILPIDAVFMSKKDGGYILWIPSSVLKEALLNERNNPKCCLMGQ